ncbi:hypothetical protein CK203_107382 [Vitis vinifera]|uniref:Uncharacterized protein n=1 Tax=Vitis vinifera TaxID=29760 RepID=A0A438ECV0_VITVI|nr:hypothetical protein CK203_107382 [Vitis vinifera]
MQFHHQYRAPPPPRSIRQFSQLRMPLSRAFQRLTLDRTLRQPLIPLGYLQHTPPMTHFLLFPEDYGPACRDVQIFTWNGRVAQPPPIDRPFVGAATREELSKKERQDFAPAAHYAGSHIHFGAFWPRLSPFNLFLNRLWIHEVGAIPSSLHQKVKFIHEGRVILIQSDRDVIASSEPMLQISHNDDDLHLTGSHLMRFRLHSYKGGCTSHDAIMLGQGSEHVPHGEEIDHMLEMVEIQDI